MNGMTPHSRRQMLLAAASLLLLPRPVRAADSPAVQPEVARVESYLNSLKTMVSRFDQVAGDGSTASGTIYIDRPGRMRIVYDKPAPILIVATGGRVFYYDGTLDQLTFTNLDDTPAWFLLQPHLRLSGDITVENVQRGPGTLRLTVTETEKAARGRVTMTFSDHPLELRQWTIVDAQNKIVRVTLDDPHFGVKVDPRLFIWTDPRGENNG
jgi:outer membrane lipoprotein-sorting protein